MIAKIVAPDNNITCKIEFSNEIYEGRCSLKKERASIDKIIEKVRLEIKRETHGDLYATNIRIHGRIRLHGNVLKIFETLERAIDHRTV